MVITHSEILDGRAAVVEVDGPLDSRTSPDFEDYLNLIIEKNVHFILFDASGMPHVSSEGIGLLLLLQRKISELNGFFVMFNLADEVSTLYALLGFDKVFRIAGSRSEALQILDRQRELREGGGHVEEEEPPAAPGPAAVDEGPRIEEAPRDSRGPVVECTACRTLMRVPPGGAYLCPSCGAIFSVPPEGREPARTGAAHGGASFAPLIVECASCSALIRVRNEGAYRCPDCGAGFNVSGDQSISFAS